MANLTLLRSFDFAADHKWDWTSATNTSTTLTIAAGPEKYTFTGEIAHPMPTMYTGPVTAASYFVSDAEVYRITGLESDLTILSTFSMYGTDMQLGLAYLLSGDDTITGSAGYDGLIGFAGNDTIRAGAGTDLVYGGEGNDTIDGGEGVDTAFFGSPYSTYKVERTSSGLTVTDSSGVEGTDTLVSIERLVFGDDKAVAMDVDADGLAGKAYRLYQAAFNRTPDAAGVGYWMNALDKGQSLESIAQGFINSKEYQDAYGTGLSNQAVVTKYYQNILHRAPEQAGLDYWSGLLDGKQASLAQVLALISESKENIDGTAALIGHGFEYTPYG